MLTRREFLGTSALLPLAASLEDSPATASPRHRDNHLPLSQSRSAHRRSFLVGYPIDGEWHKPNVQVVSLYVDQKPEGDLSAERAAEFGFKVYPTIAEAICCGGSTLGCDAILIVGEHGDYPSNDKGQKLYPRFEFFEQCRKCSKERPLCPFV